jgi:succinoglycan biosynthesis transport protein ExoP
MWLIALSLVAAIAVALVISLQLPRTYESQATLYVGQTLDNPRLDYSGLLASQILTQTYAELATTRPVLLAVIAELDLDDSAETLQKAVSTEVPLEGTLLEIAVRDGDPDRAAAIANAIAEQLIEQAPTEDPTAIADLQTRLDNLDATTDRLEAEHSGLLALQTRTGAQDERLSVIEERLVGFNEARAALLEEMRQGSPNALTVVEAAVASDVPVAPSRTLIVGLAAAASLAGSVLLAYLLDAIRRGSPAPGAEAIDGLPLTSSVRDAEPIQE